MAEKKTIKDFGYNIDEYTRYRVGLLVDEVRKVANENGCSPQEAFDGMFKASVDYAKQLKRSRLAPTN